ncbi:MAG: chorismate mutase [Caulobacterales bacterium 32-69-10]|nr:MAG: chorismate mutase [Caulobacterales bacterium 32-69-10]
MDRERSRLEEVRARIDAVDAELLRLVDERAELGREVGEIKRGEGATNTHGLNIRPDREALLLRRLLAAPRKAASAEVVVRIWRELIAESLRIQQPYQLAVWGGRNPTRIVEMARQRFGVAPGLTLEAEPEAALAAAKRPGNIAVLALEPGSRWWGRLLAEPNLRVFATLPCLNSWGPQGALAVGAVASEPSGLDETYWVTDAPDPAAAVEAALEREGVAARLIQETGGLKLFGLPGYFQPDDQRLARAPGRLSGVIGAASAPFDL